jgi:hypothetical protein
LHPPLSCALPFPRPVARALRLWSLPDMPNTALIVGESGPHSVKPKPPLRLYLQPPRRSDSVKPCLTIRLRVSLVGERQKSQNGNPSLPPCCSFSPPFPSPQLFLVPVAALSVQSLVVSLAKMALPDSPPDLLEDSLAAPKRTVAHPEHPLLSSPLCQNLPPPVQRWKRPWPGGSTLCLPPPLRTFPRAFLRAQTVTIGPSPMARRLRPLSASLD